MGRKRLSSNDSVTTTTSNSPVKFINTTAGGMQQRNAANARERARMRVLSKAFIKLKTHLPWVPHDTKLSKLDTLRLATSYILHLTQILDTDELPIQTIAAQPTTTSLSLQTPNNFNWPYSSCHRSSSLCAMNGRLSSSPNINNNSYTNNDYQYQIQSELLDDHQENIIEEKPRLC
ncbi:unnamed protein product [Rotaria magnacalcarata]|uniref:BHLH domain-containing protein n=1 Tax=Rotaria magnacalcarata TaxID=392030 RepID=A0A816KK34_9BILA|nr:unnamed protein product [Rotaria magnacalcarata]CAF1685149.1 unnamed protein product [Rotaria magnacalcarata]CAF1920243.1 unnamed protein product [Rotaria magnacalcarata]CAF2092387.1 unnamed protein product [Rotaria magnacalcarata]CAF2129420.1 unnamed protein product [Rotaria magnacalcarata]